MSSPSINILLLGAGELGTALLHPIRLLPNTQITVGLRSPQSYTHLTCPNVSITRLDTTWPSPTLSSQFSAYDIIISATGFGQDAGAMSKLANEVLEAGRLRKLRGEGAIWFFPWQWGVDYDVTGDGQGLMPLFGEQKHVRDVLRAQAHAANVKWTVVSTGIFMSFLFEPFWGIVDRSQEQKGGRVLVRALASWDHKITVTHVDDIGRVLARIIAGDAEAENRVVYVAGDTVSYGELAGIVERVTDNEVGRVAWGIPHLKEDLSKDPDNIIKKYRLVFAREGVWWDKERTVNAALAMDMTDVEKYATRLLIGSD